VLERELGVVSGVGRGDGERAGQREQLIQHSGEQTAIKSIKLPYLSLLSSLDLQISCCNMIPTGASAAVLKPSDPIPVDAVSVEGPNFDKTHTFHDFMKSYERIGFQANSLGKAIDIVNKMVRKQ